MSKDLKSSFAPEFNEPTAASFLGLMEKTDLRDSHENSELGCLMKLLKKADINESNFPYLYYLAHHSSSVPKHKKTGRTIHWDRAFNGKKDYFKSYQRSESSRLEKKSIMISDKTIISPSFGYLKMVFFLLLAHEFKIYLWTGDPANLLEFTFPGDQINKLMFGESQDIKKKLSVHHDTSHFFFLDFHYVRRLLELLREKISYFLELTPRIDNFKETNRYHYRRINFKSPFLLNADIIKGLNPNIIAVLEIQDVMESLYIDEGILIYTNFLSKLTQVKSLSVILEREILLKTIIKHCGNLKMLRLVMRRNRLIDFSSLGSLHKLPFLVHFCIEGPPDVILFNWNTLPFTKWNHLKIIHFVNCDIDISKCPSLPFIDQLIFGANCQFISLSPKEVIDHLKAHLRPDCKIFFYRIDAPILVKELTLESLKKVLPQEKKECKKEYSEQKKAPYH
jgi:hypothetical protein